MQNNKLQNQYESYSEKQIADLIAGGNESDQETKYLWQLLLKRRREHYCRLIDSQSKPPLKSSEPKENLLSKGPEPKNTPPPKNPEPTKPKTSSASDNNGCMAPYAVIAILVAFWTIPNFGWWGLLMALWWPFVVMFYLIASFFL